MIAELNQAETAKEKFALESDEIKSPTQVLHHLWLPPFLTRSHMEPRFGGPWEEGVHVTVKKGTCHQAQLGRGEDDYCKQRARELSREIQGPVHLGSTEGSPSRRVVLGNCVNLSLFTYTWASCFPLSVCVKTSVNNRCRNLSPPRASTSILVNVFAAASLCNCDTCIHSQ